MGEGKSCLVCGTATVAKFLGDFPLPRKVNIRIVGMQTMCRESIGPVSDYAITQELTTKMRLNLGTVPQITA